jgi:hypothetical protein
LFLGPVSAGLGGCDGKAPGSPIPHSWDIGSWSLDVVWQEGREGEESSMSATVKQRKTGVGDYYLVTRGGSPRLRGSNSQ